MTTPFVANFCSLNVRGINQTRKRRQLFRWLHNNKFDIIFLQETYSTKSIETVWKSEWGGDVYYSHGTNHSRGTMILFNPKLPIHVDDIIADENGRFLLLKATVHDTEFQLCNIYSPNNSTDQKDFYSNLLNILKHRSDHKMIVGGDFNCALTPCDKIGGSDVNKKNNVISEIRNLCSSLKLLDVWRCQHPNQQQFTWRDKAFKVQCRLDYWMVSEDLKPLALDTNIKNSTLTDHSAITLTIQSQDYVRRGPGFWKINNSLLKDNNFIDQLSEKIPQFKDKYSYLSDKGLAWDMIKMEIRGFCVQYSKRKNRERRNIEKELSGRMERLMKILETNRSKENIIELYRLRSELNKIAEYRTNGAIIRSRTRWHEHGEKNTKYFLNLEKRQHSNSFIARLKTQDDQEITQANEILECQKKFYTDLYIAVPTDRSYDKTFFDDAKHIRLSDAEQTDLEKPLTKEECFKTLKECAKNKCPGSDGLSVEFYLHFWPLLGDEMVSSFDYAFTHGKLNITQKQGIIKVVPKKRKNRLYLENWRPISLLNIDYKIAAKAIASRLSKVLPKIINDDQTGYIQGRYIGQNIRLIQDIMKVTSLENIPGLAIFIDFKKAFDSLDWNFLNKTLQSFNLGPYIQKWVKTFYTDISSCVVNNGYASEFFHPQRGVRQGCPLSGILFVLCAEILANAIRNNQYIKGIKIHDKEFKISQYADDTTAFVSDITSAEKLFEILNAFQLSSGLEVNKSKTEAMWLGALRHNPEAPSDITWPSKPINSLGIDFTYNEEVSYKKNFEQKLTSMKSILNIWLPRNLTLYGRITILKTLGLSKLIYNTSMLSFPPNFPVLVKQIISDFVWNSKPAKIKHTTMIGPKTKGGLDLPDFDIITKALKVSWIRRLHESNLNACWSHIPLSYIKHLGGPFLFECNYNLKSLKIDIPIDFYKDVFYIWQTINQHTPETKEQIFNEIIWNNSFIKIEGFSVYYRKWYESGVVRIKDIFCGNNFLTFNDFYTKFQIKTTFLKYCGLCNAIPASWIRLLKSSADEAQRKSDHNQKIDIGKLSCKVATKILIDKKFETPTAERRMRQLSLDDSTIRAIYDIPFKVTKDIRLSIFQFKIIHHILPTNSTLYRDKIKDHDKCHLCTQTQTLRHLFVSCPNVQAFWNTFATWWNVKNDDSIELHEKNIIYGFTINSPLRLDLNLCVLIAKYYIYTASKDEQHYYFETFLALLKDKISIEKSSSKSQIQL